jgi:hypothetical protein
MIFLKKNLKIILSRIIALIVGCLIVFIIVKTASYFFYSIGLLEDPKEVLLKYKIGSKLNDLTSDERIMMKFEGPLKTIYFTVNGYSSPGRELKKGEKVLIVDKGEWIVYLYYNDNDALIYKSISGS